MLERVRLHPHLITGNRDMEISSQRWRNMESQDVVIDCAKMSLDVMEGMWEESSEALQKNILHKPLDQPKTRDLQIHTKGKRSTDSYQKQEIYRYIPKTRDLQLHTKNKKSTDTYQKQEIYSYIPKVRDLQLHTKNKRSTATYQR